MSLFNKVVPMHPAANMLKWAVRWAVPDKESKYPLLGRLRYVWMSPDYKHIKLLLKDGPSSWSEEREKIMAQILEHEGFVSVEVVERDPVYITATLKPCEDFSWIPENQYFGFQVLDRENVPMKDFVEELLRDIPAYNANAIRNGFESVTDDPFELFDKALEIEKVLKAAGTESNTAHELRTMIEEAIKKDKDGGIIKIES